MAKNYHNQAILSLMGANIIWGAASPIFKLTLQDLPPFTLAFVRFFGAMLIMLPFAADKLWIDKKDWLKIIFLSLSGVTVNISFFFLGLQLAPAINAPIIASSGPVFLYIFSIFILKEKNHPKVLLGTIIALFGVLTIIGQPFILRRLDREFIGNIFFLIATLGSVGHAVFSKEVLPKYQAITVTFWSFLIGNLTFFPFFVQEMVKYHPFMNVDYRGLLGIIFGIFFSSALAYFLFEWSIEKLPVQEVGVFTYIDPVVATLIAVPLLKETITIVFLAGSLMVFSGIFIAEGRLQYHPWHNLKKI